jgi:hypothetical protein
MGGIVGEGDGPARGESVGLACYDDATDAAIPSAIHLRGRPLALCVRRKRKGT